MEDAIRTCAPNIEYIEFLDHEVLNIAVMERIH